MSDHPGLFADAETGRPAANHLLLAENDEPLADRITLYFDRAGYRVTRTGNGQEALTLAHQSKPDLIVLAWELEGISGFEICRRLRRGTPSLDVPILLLAPRYNEDDCVRGLEFGADDVIAKPLSPRELVARAAAVLRRVRPLLVAEVVRFAGIEIDVAAHRVSRDGKPIRLGPTEYRLLRHLIENPGQVFSRQQLLESVWPHNEDVELRTVDVHIRRLRNALAEHGGDDVIRTLRSAGYSLDTDCQGRQT